MTAIKYEVGDKVRVRRDLKYLERRDGLYVNTKMAEMGGQILTITGKNWCVEYEVLQNERLWNDELLEPVEEYTEGEEVEVSRGGSNWYKAIYLHTYPGNKLKKYGCVSCGDEEKHKEGRDYGTTLWKYIRKLKKTIVIKSESGEELEISKEKAEELGFKIK